MDEKSFSVDQKKLISQIFAKIAKISDAKIENNNFHNQHVLISVLIPVTIAIGDFIERCIKDCNKKKGLLKFHYFVTNTHKPSKEETEQYLEEFEN